MLSSTVLPKETENKTVLLKLIYIEKYTDCSEVDPQLTHAAVTPFMLLLLFKVLKYYICSRIFSSIMKKQLCLGELCQRVPDLRLSGILTRS